MAAACCSSTTFEDVKMQEKTSRLQTNVIIKDQAKLSLVSQCDSNEGLVPIITNELCKLQVTDNSEYLNDNQATPDLQQSQPPEEKEELSQFRKELIRRRNRRAGIRRHEPFECPVPIVTDECSKLHVTDNSENSNDDQATQAVVQQSPQEDKEELSDFRKELMRRRQRRQAAGTLGYESLGHVCQKLKTIEETGYSGRYY